MLMERSCNVQERWTVRNAQRSGTLNGQERLETNSGKHYNWSRYIHVHASKTKETLFIIKSLYKNTVGILVFEIIETNKEGLKPKNAF